MLVVTGGGGFIGSVLVWALNEAGRADIVIVDKKYDADQLHRASKPSVFDSRPGWYATFSQARSDGIMDRTAAHDEKARLCCRSLYLLLKCPGTSATG
jgi:nucleoside-diphosphate-sugar epimerase